MDGLAREFIRRARQRHAAFHHAVNAVGDLHRLADVLFHNDERGARFLDFRHRLVDVADHDRRETERNFIAQEHTRIAHQRPANGDHLLLAARKGCARIVAAFLEDREEVVNRLQVPVTARFAAIRADQQVLFHRQRWKQAPALWDHSHTHRHDGICGRIADGASIERHRLAIIYQHARDGPHERCFAGTIRADDGNGFTLVEVNIHAKQRLEIAIMGGEIFGRQKRHQISIPK